MYMDAIKSVLFINFILAMIVGNLAARKNRPYTTNSQSVTKFLF